jgi:hypothetical protein
MAARPQQKKTKRRRKDTIARARQLENGTLGLRHIGFHEFGSYEEFDKRGKLLLPDRYVIPHFPHETLYGTGGYKERYIYDHGIEYIFEAKLQNGSGSVDEKLPYLWESFLVSPYPNWIVWFDGNWFTKNPRGIAAIAWLRRRAAEAGMPGRRLDVCASDDEWVDLVARLFQQAGP